MIDVAFALGVRVFLLERLAITLEVRDLIYLERGEASTAAAGPTTLPLNDPNNPDNPATWSSSDSRLTNSVQVRLGANIFVF